MSRLRKAFSRYSAYSTVADEKIIRKAARKRDVCCSCFSNSLNDKYIRGDNTFMNSCIGAHKREARRLQQHLKVIRRSPMSHRGVAGGADHTTWLIRAVTTIERFYPQIVWQRQSARSAKNMVANGEMESKDWLGTDTVVRVRTMHAMACDTAAAQSNLTITKKNWLP